MAKVYEARIEELFDKYVPSMGKSDILAGELIRAVCKLRYEMYNNGFGNNVSGALNFLDANVPGLTPEFKALYDNARGIIYFGDYSNICPKVKAMNSLMTKVVEFINEHPETETTPNEVDMYELEDEPYEEEEEEYYEEEECY